MHQGGVTEQINPETRWAGAYAPFSRRPESAGPRARGEAELAPGEGLGALTRGSQRVAAVFPEDSAHARALNPLQVPCASKGAAEHRLPRCGHEPQRHGRLGAATPGRVGHRRPGKPLPPRDTQPAAAPAPARSGTLLLPTSPCAHRHTVPSGEAGCRRDGGRSAAGSATHGRAIPRQGRWEAGGTTARYAAPILRSVRKRQVVRPEAQQGFPEAALMCSETRLWCRPRNPTHLPEITELGLCGGLWSGSFCLLSCRFYERIRTRAQMGPGTSAGVF